MAINYAQCEGCCSDLRKSAAKAESKVEQWLFLAERFGSPLRGMGHALA